ncbi:MAG: MarR family transcriptional regulator [bacterium]
MSENIIKFSEDFHRLINKLVEREMVPRVLDSGELLYRIEIHVIVAIAENPGINLTGLSEVLGVTKGAISQKVKILEKKEYIKRYKNFDNNKEILFELTERGNGVFLGHQEFHKQLNQKIFKGIGNINDSDLENIVKIFKVIENHLETL